MLFEGYSIEKSENIVAASRPGEICGLVSAGGIPITQVRDVPGHSTVVMTERYAHLAPENVRQAVSVLDDPETFRLRLGHGGERKEKMAITK